MRRALALLLSVGVLLSLAAVPVAADDDDDDDGGRRTRTGLIRAFHNSPDTPAVDIFVNGTEVLSGVTFGTVSDYLSVPRGSYLVEVKVAPAGPADAAALSKKVRVGDKPITVAAIGSLLGDGGALRLTVLKDRTGAPGSWARLRVAHTSPDAPAVDVQARIGSTWVRVIRNLEFGESSRYLTLPTRTWGQPIAWDFRVVVAGTNTVAIDLPDTILPAGRALTVWAVGFLSPNGGAPALGVQITPDGRNAF